MLQELNEALSEAPDDKHNTCRPKSEPPGYFTAFFTISLKPFDSWKSALN